MYSAVKPQKTPSIKKPLSWVKLPMFWAVVLGVVCGLVCRRLPDNIRSFLVDGLADPISSVVLALIAGVTGPVIFLSLITSISSLGSISKLTDLGFKIMWRFIKCTLFIIGVSIMVSLLFYNVFGAGAIQFSPDQLVSMLLNLIPTNIVAPFLNNNTPQLVILGILLGAALLLLEDRVANLAASLRSLKEWSSTASTSPRSEPSRILPSSESRESSQQRSSSSREGGSRRDARCMIRIAFCARSAAAIPRRRSASAHWTTGPSSPHRNPKPSNPAMKSGAAYQRTANGATVIARFRLAFLAFGPYENRSTE